MALNQLTFNGRQIARAVMAYPIPGPTARFKPIELWGVNGELGIRGGRGGRTITIPAFVEARTMAALDSAIESIYELIDQFGDVKVLGSRAADNRRFKDCYFADFRETSDRIPDLVGGISAGGYMVQAIFTFRQLRVEQ